MDNPFSWDYLTASVRETELWGPFSIAYLILFGSIFIISAFVFADANRRFATHKLNRDTVRRFATWLMWSSGIALFFLGVRLLQTQMLTLEKRIWMYLAFLAFLAVVARIALFMRNEYPAQLAAFEKSRERRAWQHAARRPGGQKVAQTAKAKQPQAAARRRRAVR